MLNDRTENRKNEGGALAIEAVLGITIFLITILSVMFISLIIRVQANVQYALGQTAKEISGYYYLLDKMGLASVTTGSDPTKTKDVDKSIQDVFDLYGEAEEIGDNFSNVDFSDVNVFEINQMANESYEKIAAKSNELGSQLELLSQDPGKQVTAILSVFAKTMANKAMSFYIAPYVCRAIMPRYMGGSLDKANKMLEAAGVKGGMSSVDFSKSQLLTDRRSIKLVATYKLDVSKITFGIVRSEIILRQVASTAAWVRPDGNNLKYLKQLSPPATNKKESAQKKEEFVWA